MELEILSHIQSPKDLRLLSPEKLPALAEEIRELMIETVSLRGGHLAPSLGAVDLTLALHFAFDTPDDKLIWDVGHQAYAHKIITGRRDQFDTLRQYGGISGFPRVGESEYDTLSVGHASTSISAALGMATARDLRGETHKIVAVIGDGAMSGGLAFEGLNNISSRGTGMIIVLNDNEMSISRNVGALSRYFTRVITDKRYNRLKTEVWTRLGQSNVGKSIRGMVQSIDDAVKHVVIPGKLFEDMGLRYIGPVDGHNIAEMIDVFRSVREASQGAVLVHVLTKKGKGYSFAENDATKFHGISSFSRSTGTPLKGADGPPTYSEVFGSTMVELGKDHEDIVAITAAMPDGTKLSQFRDTFPERFFDVGIAEEHAATFAAGLALSGLKPVVALYSTFLQRVYDQIVHDIALDKLHVVFCIDRAGLVGDDGPTHHGMFDLSFLRTVPGVTIMAPRDERELRNMIYTAVLHTDGPVFVRYPRGRGVGAPTDGAFEAVPNEPAVLQEGKGCAVLTVGHFLPEAQRICDALRDDGHTPTLVDARFVKPLNETFYRRLYSSHAHIITLEPNSLAGGFGSAILELLTDTGLKRKPSLLRLGYPDTFVAHGNVTKLLQEHGLDSETLVARARSFVPKRRTTSRSSSRQYASKARSAQG
ncbi:MAG: 1-deoxy-D-xylulose-5-phosphate synthase [Chitinivibrionales bacterium]|nr:1-deoxy-D-xylulose-5-phosphate synthase [Chitinivibrionales bacterium]